MARRDLWRHKARTLVTMLLVAIPVVVGVAVAQLHHNARWEGERAAYAAMGAADALVEVTPHDRVRVRYWPGEMVVRPAGSAGNGGPNGGRASRDDEASDLVALLPTGSRFIEAPVHHDVALSTGGVGHLVIIDGADPMAEGFAAITAGRAPTAPDEVAVSRTAADELGLLDAGGEPVSDAELELLDGRHLAVVGVAEPSPDVGYGGSGVHLLAHPDSVLAESSRAGPDRYLVDLPASVGEAPHALVDELARRGVGMLPRDVMFHPEAWGVRDLSQGPVDPRALAIGALVVLFGLVEVVLVVGSAFAVGARRQVRDLGLVAASGGAPADVRRVLLAQGLAVGVGASLLGCVLGVATFLVAAPVFAEVTGQQIWSRDLDWLSVVGVTALGALTGLVAAFIPARSIGRLTPVAALSGRFPVRPGESRAHRPAFVLAASGLVVLALGGWWSAVEYAPPAQQPGGREAFATPSTLPVVVGSIGLLTLIAGVVWSAPYVVRRLAVLGRLLPISGRFAFRDAARHRFRTAAAAVSLTVTVAGAIFAGFTVQAVAADLERNSDGGVELVHVHADATGAHGNSDRTDELVRTVLDVLGPAETVTAARAARGHRGWSELAVAGRRGAYAPVRVVDEATLAGLVEDDDAALDAFRDGRVVTTSATGLRDGVLRVSMSTSRRQPQESWRLPATVVRGSGLGGEGDDLFATWISEDVVRRLGLVTVPTMVTFRLDHAVTSEELTRLAVHGIDAWSPGTDLETIGQVRLAVGAAAGILTMLVVGIAVALSAAEGRADQATMAAVGAGPWRRRALGAMHGFFLGLVGVLLGGLVGVPAGMALLQVDGAPGIAIPIVEVAGIVAAVPLLGWAAGWLVSSTRLTMVRRTG